MELNRLFDFVEQIYRKADVGAAFGEPQTVGDKTIIPVARVGYGLGVGFGEGEMPSGAEAPEAPGAGGGGGGGGMATPMAAVELSDGEVNVVPIVDSTRIALAGILLVAWSVYWIGKTIRVLKGRWSVG